MKIFQPLSAVLVITIIMGLIYASVIQTYRSNTSDPQIQIVHDIKDRLQRDKQVGELFFDPLILVRAWLFL